MYPLSFKCVLPGKNLARENLHFHWNLHYFGACVDAGQFLPAAARMDIPQALGAPAQIQKHKKGRIPLPGNPAAIYGKQR